jgi:hypothetical protein
MRRDPVGIAFAIAIALLLALAFSPAIAQAPPQVTVKPLAVCENGRCSMSQEDYETLQQFHADRIGAILEASEVIDALQKQNQELMRMLARDAAGCKGRRI